MGQTHGKSSTKTRQQMIEMSEFTKTMLVGNWYKVETYFSTLKARYPDIAFMVWRLPQRAGPELANQMARNLVISAPAYDPSRSTFMDQFNDPRYRMLAVLVAEFEHMGQGANAHAMAFVVDKHKQTAEFFDGNTGEPDDPGRSAIIKELYYYILALTRSKGYRFKSVQSQPSTMIGTDPGVENFDFVRVQRGPRCAIYATMFIQLRVDGQDFEQALKSLDDLCAVEDFAKKATLRARRRRRQQRLRLVSGSYRRKKRLDIQ